jgi:nickel transport system substrate-binding protein
MVFSLAACNTGETSGDASETSTASGDVSESKTVALCENWDFESGFFTPLHPGNSAGGHGVSYYLPNMYETLVEVKNGEIIPALAESWDVSDDGLTYTFHLKENVKFSDGSDFNAEVVKLNWDALPGIMGQYNGAFGVTGTLIESAEVIDTYTVALHLTTPYYGVLNDLTIMSPMGIMGAAAYNEDMTLSDAVLTASFGTGPYMYAGDYDGTTYTFVRNPYYHGEAPDVDSFTVTVITDTDAAVLALRSGEIDMLWGSHAISYDAMSEFENDSTFKTLLDEKAQNVTYLSFNVSTAPFDDVSVRNAVAMAIDKASLTETVFDGLVASTNRLFPTSYPYCNTDTEGKEFDLEETKQLLDEAGYVDTDGDGIREKDGQPLSVTMPYISENSTSDNAMLFIAAQLKAIGMDVEVSGMDQMSWFGVMMQGDWGISSFHTYGPSYDPYTIMSNMDVDMQSDPCAWQVSLVLSDGDAIFKELNNSTEENRIKEIYSYVLEEIYGQSILVPLYENYPPAIFNTEKIASVDINGSTYLDCVEVSKIELK